MPHPLTGAPTPEEARTHLQAMKARSEDANVAPNWSPPSPASTRRLPQPVPVDQLDAALDRADVAIRVAEDALVAEKDRQDKLGQIRSTRETELRRRYGMEDGR